VRFRNIMFVRFHTIIFCSFEPFPITSLVLTDVMVTVMSSALAQFSLRPWRLHGLSDCFSRLLGTDSFINSLTLSQSDTLCNEVVKFSVHCGAMGGRPSAYLRARQQSGWRDDVTS